MMDRYSTSFFSFYCKEDGGLANCPETQEHLTVGDTFNSVSALEGFFTAVNPDVLLLQP